MDRCRCQWNHWSMEGAAAMTPVGRPEIGQPINIRLGDDLLAQVDKMALAYGWGRALSFRHLVAMGLDAERKARG